MKATAETPAIYLEKFLKQFERMSDAGELYRGMLHLFSNNLEKAIPVFEQFIKKDRDAESMFYQAIAYQVQGNQAKASNGYAMAIRKIEDEIVETSFEKLAGSPKAKLDLLRLKNIKIDYQFALQKLASKPENITSVDTDQTNAIKGEVRSAKSIYTFLVEKQEDNSYQLVVRDKMMRKVMLSSLKVEKKGEAIAVKIIWGDKKDDAGMSWAVRPQDFFIATYSPTSVEYKHEGERLQNAKNNKIDWTAMAEIRPTKITENEVLPYAVRSFMVGYLIKD
jgi:tetratricopeptide (TPR) repeat protein